MIEIIAHRGLLNGPNINTENTFEAIMDCFALGFSVELDVWIDDNHIPCPRMHLGHDNPKLFVDDSKRKLFYENKDKIYWHCKDSETIDFHVQIEYLNPEVRYFFHQNDDLCLTSNKKLWTFPGKKLEYNSIAVLPETCNKKYYNQVIKLAANERIQGICTDFPIKVLKDIKKLQKKYMEKQNEIK
jgi:hypothetical protein